MILSHALLLAAVGAAVAVPPWPFSPDGESVAVLADAPLEADGARVEREEGRIWRVVPEPGRGAVRLRVAGETIEAQVAPSPGKLAFTIEPREPVKGRDREVRIVVEATGARGEPLALENPPALFGSAGRLGPLVPTDSPGRFAARWEPSDSARPEVLGLVAIAPRCPLCATPLASGVAHFPIAAAIDLPGRTDPGVETRVEIAGRIWGPVRASADGRFSVPVIVPPGTRWAFATSLSALGNERRTRLDLGLPETVGFQCGTWPERVPADGRTESGILCVGWSPAGGTIDPRPLRATATRGAISGEKVEGEAWSARYRPPRGGADDAISVEWTRAPGIAARLPMRPGTGPPGSIRWAVEGEPILPGRRVRVEARALDLRGAELGDASAADGSVRDGWLQARDDFGDGVQRVALAFSIPPGGPPASLTLHRAGDDWIAAARDVDARPVAGVPVRFASGKRATTDSNGEARSAAASGTAEIVEGPGGLRAAGWAGAPAAIPAITVTRAVRVALRPPGTVDVDAAVDGRWLRWVVRSADGAPIPGRAVAVAGGGVDLGPVEVDGAGGRCALRAGHGTVAITDAESGIVALVEVK